MQPKPSRSLIPNNPNKPTVLVAENDSTTRLLMEVMLKQEGFSVVLAADSTEALDLLDKHRINGVVLGTLMMGMVGTEFCKRLRADPQTSNLPILMVLSTTDAMSVERSKLAGANDHLTKPVIAHELITKVRAMLRGE